MKTKNNYKVTALYLLFILPFFCLKSIAQTCDIIPNPSFEGSPNPPNNLMNLELSGNWFNPAYSSTSDYHNYYGGFDFSHPPLPLPNGTGFIGTIIQRDYQEWFGTCLSNPFLAGVTYSFEMDIASMGTLSNASLNIPTTPISGGPIDITIYGNTACANYPLQIGIASSPGAQALCPSEFSPAWMVIASANYTPVFNSWTTLTFTFTPSTNINAIIIGAPCVLPSTYTESLNIQPSIRLNYFIYDNIVFNPITISYPDSNYCQNNNTIMPTITGSIIEGIFSATPSGLIIDPTTGEIDLSSPVNNYTVSYIAPGTCGDTDTAIFTVNIRNENLAVFSYSGPYCQDGTNPFPTLSPGTIAGTFSSSPVGLTLANNSTGEVNLSTSTPGTYTVTNTVPADGSCPATSSTATITIATENSADFSYSGPYCQNGTDPIPTIDPGSDTGTFTSTPGGLVFSGSNGTVDLSASTPGTYTVTNALPASGPCPAVSATSTITIYPVQSTAFTYTRNVYCQSTGNATPTISGTGGGTFTVTPAGLIIDSTTGVIDLSSPANLYTITYTAPQPCGNSSSQIVQIVNSLSLSISSLEICEGEVTTLVAVPSVPGGTFSWTPGGQSSGSIDIAPDQTTTYTVTNSLDGCTATASATVTINTVTASITTPYSTISAGETIELQSGNAGAYLWSSGQTTQAISVSPIENTTYCVMVTENGCTDSTCISIKIGCNPVIYAPNSITVNGDKINDEFLVKADCITEFHLMIFNRWGELIFETFDIAHSWDGTYKSMSVSDNVYTYSIVAKGIDNKYFDFQGFITVLR